MSKASRGKADDPLDRYRSMRHFDKTAEPAGARPGRSAADEAPAGGQFVVQRHRARRLHYDLRLELDGVLVSWAVPKGPPLDPSARVLAVKVEDHPLEYADFEGVIPGGEYGGGDVIVWDRGTWTPARPGDPAAAIAGGELHFDLHGEKLQGPVPAHPARPRRQRQGAVAAAAQEGRLRRARLGPRGASGIGEDRPHQRRRGGGARRGVAQRPCRRTAERRRPPPLPDVRRADGRGARAPSTSSARPARGSFQGRELKLTNLDKVLFPARPDGQGPFTKRDLIRYHAQIAPVMLPYLVDRPVNLHRFPNGVDKPGFWHKAVPSHAPAWLQRWRYDDARPGETEWYFVIDSPPALVWMANYGAVELHPWTSRRADAHQPTWAYIDIDPGHDHDLRRHRAAGPALPHRARPPRRDSACPKVTGQRGIQIWVPIADGLHLRRHAGVGRGAVARRRRHRARAGELEVAQVRS